MGWLEHPYGFTLAAYLLHTCLLLAAYLLLPCRLLAARLPLIYRHLDRICLKCSVKIGKIAKRLVKICRIPKRSAKIVNELD